MFSKGKIITLRSMVGMLSVNWWSEATFIYAQTDKTDVTKDEKGYFLAYVVVLFIIALGVAIVARSGRRAEKPKMIEKELEYRLEKLSGKSSDR